jgi:hypothetical protein
VPYVLLLFPLSLLLLCLAKFLCASDRDALADLGTVIAAALCRSCTCMKRSQVLVTELQPLDQVCIVLGMGYVILFVNINSRIVFATGFGGIFSSTKAPVGSAFSLSKEPSAPPGAGEEARGRF